jgi:Fe-S cluster assembly scaffold protein SufB
VAGRSVPVRAAERVDRPAVPVVHGRHAAGSSIFTHTLVVLEENAEAFLVDAYNSETQQGLAYASGVVELIQGKSSKLRYVQVQDWGRNVHHMMTERATLDRDATLNSLHVTLGSKWTKASIGSHMRGENSLAGDARHLVRGLRPVLRPPHLAAP